MMGMSMRFTTPARNINGPLLIKQRSSCSLRPLPVPLARLSPFISTAATSSTSDTQPAADAELTDALLGFTPPSVRHQPALSGKERAALRAQSETLAKNKALQRVQVGAQGITFNVLMACMDILMKYEYLRIKLGEGCGCDRKETAAMLSQLLDAAVVGQVGFTITLYRQKGLPRPDNLVKPAAQAA